ncbi:MAG: hypothetical protein WC813_03335 [Patescibacteria group bacterium]|jgi:hypothetical protein
MANADSINEIQIDSSPLEEAEVTWSGEAKITPMPSPEGVPERGPEKPATTPVERLGNNGEIEVWNAYALDTDKGKVYFINQRNKERWAMVPEAEWLVEQELLEATKKFSGGKTWSTFTSLLTESKDGSAEQTKLKEYLDQNKGRILEFAAWMAKEYKISKEQAIEHTKEKVKAEADKATDKRYFELDYAVIAKAINEETSAFKVREWATEDAILTAREKSAAVVNWISRQVQIGEAKPSEEVTLNLDLRRAIRGDQKLERLMLDHELEKPANKADLETPLAALYAKVATELDALYGEIKNSQPSLGELRQESETLINDFKLYSYAAARDLAKSASDLSPQLKEFFGLSAETKTKRASKTKASKPLEPISEAFGGRIKNIQNIPGDTGADEVPFGFANPEQVSVSNREAPQNLPVEPEKAEITAVMPKRPKQVTRRYVVPEAPRTISEQLQNLPETIEAEKTELITPEERQASLAKTKIEKPPRIKSKARMILDQSLMEEGKASEPGWLETQNADVIPLPEKEQPLEPGTDVPKSRKAKELEADFDKAHEPRMSTFEEQYLPSKSRNRPNIFKRMWNALFEAEDAAFEE